MNISLPNLNDIDFRSLESTEKKFGGSGIIPSYFPALMNLAIFLPFFTIQSQGIELTKTLLFILKVLWCSNNLMQQMTSKTPSIFKIIHLKVFFKKMLEILTIFKGLAYPTRCLVTFELFCSFASDSEVLRLPHY